MNPAPRPSRRRTPVLMQVGQTLFVLGVAILLIGVAGRGGRSAVLLGAALLAVGLVLFGVGLTRRSGRAGDD